MNAMHALDAYRRTDATSEVEAASPHRLIQIVLQRAIEQIRLAGATSDIKVRRDASARAIGLIDVLRESLTMDNEMTRNLGALYDYLTQRLISAAAGTPAEAFERDAELLETIKSAWDELPALAQEQGGMAPEVEARLHAS